MGRISRVKGKQVGQTLWKLKQQGFEILPICKKKYFTSEQLLGEHFHLELCKQHKTVLSHFMRQNLHGNRGHPLDRTKIGRASLRVVEDDPRVEEMTQVSVTFSSH